MSPPKLYPLFLKLEGRRVLVVGGGIVAQRKVRDLVRAGAQVDVIAPKASSGVRRLATEGTVTWQARSFVPSDAEGAWLVVAAADDPAVQRGVAEAAAAQRTFFVAVDDPPNSSAYSASIVRRGPFILAISSGGATPALTRLLREILEQVLPDEEWVQAARALRARWRKEHTPMADRFGELVRAFKQRAGE